MTDTRDLILLSKAQRALTEASTIDDVRNLRDRAAAARTYAQKARLGKHLVIDAAALRIRAERRLGQMLQETPLANSAPGNQHTGPNDESSADAITLNDLGITKKESSRSQRIADIPGPTFEMYLAECTETEREPTFAGLLRTLRPQPQSDIQPSKVQPILLPEDNAFQWAIPDDTYSTILAIPPWPDRTPAGRRELTTDELCQLPASSVCRQQAHLYLWTSSRYLIDAFDVLEAWGFAYQTSVVCVYEPTQSIAPWGDAHNFLLVGVRGKLGFQPSSSPSWLSCERSGVGRVPDPVPNLIEATSPAPYLLLFGCQESPGEHWTQHTPPLEQ